MAPFQVGEEMGEGETEGEGRGWGRSAISGGVVGHGRRAGGWRLVGRRPRLLDTRRKRVKGAGPNWAGRRGLKAGNNWADVEKSKGKRMGCQNHLGRKQN
jgi:hypothetical protein